MASRKVACPPKEEQAAITEKLDEWLAALDELAREAEKGIALLQERRTALISAAVTGKIDVRQSSVARDQRHAGGMACATD